MTDSDHNKSKTESHSQNQDIKNMSFEQALQELETIVSCLERGDSALEESIKLYERGAVLKSHCEKRLSSAQMRIDKVISQDGQIRLEKTEV